MSRAQKFSLDLFVGDDDVEVTGTYYPGDPGNVTGLPENCWPPEPDGVEIEAVLLDGLDVLDALTSDELDRLEEDIRGYKCEPEEPDYDEPEREEVLPWN